MRSIKCVVIGDGAVGKTSLLISYTTNTFPTDYVPTVFDNYTTTISVNPPLSYNNNTNIPHDVNLFKLNLWDTAGQEEYDRLRPLSYPQTDIFLLCFAINERTSFKNLKEKWIPELKQHANIENNDMWQSFHKLPIILIGTKSDLRDESVDEEDCVDTDDINAFVEHNHLLKYVECSAKNQTGINEIFQTVVQKLVYEYDPISLKPKQAESSTSTSTQQLQASPPTPPPEKIEKKLSNKEPKKKQSSSINTTTQLQKKRSIHHEKVSSSSSSSNNNKPPKTNRRKTSCIIM